MEEIGLAEQWDWHQLAEVEPSRPVCQELTERMRCCCWHLPSTGRRKCIAALPSNLLSMLSPCQK